MSHYLYNKGEALKYERGISLSNFLGELMTDIVKYGFYTVDPDYLEYLNGIDSEVYYTSSYRNIIRMRKNAHNVYIRYQENGACAEWLF